ncbi:helix-turn-helix transcriptional regulator [Catenuloplanes atrovinosus]|uniref:AraC-like DNA-binding protein n=1 Tax=Catenuloplanes atrovinosus TaxID=137266 RepID=A0AAE3YVR8_9ACTN|nr:helix-turn-helix transcriptional regulator [Catenuloplanes atrovinosus]MDR7279249.1 AraC-like DNA-binding protein [Catenuloplanes atrovinosus]
MSSLHFDSTDLGQTEEFLSMAYTKMSLGGQAERTRAQVTREAAGSLWVDELTFNFDLAHDAEVPMGKVCLCSVRSGGVVRRYFPEGMEGRFAAGDVFMYSPHDRPYAGVIKGAHYDLLMFDPELLDQVAAAAPGRRPEPVRITGDRPVSRASAQRLRSAVRYLHDHVLTDPVARDSPLTVSTASQLAASVVLSVFPNNALLLPTAGDNHDAHPATLRRATAYVDAHAAEPITVADIAAAASTTGRAVQAAFRRHRGITPMAYLRQVRLDGAHRDLRAAAPGSGTTVEEIAARWGFHTVARFTSLYRRQYGTAPRRTLHG